MLRIVTTLPIARSPGRVIHAYLVLPHAVPVVVVMTTTLGCSVLVPDDLPAWDDLALVLLAMLGGQLAIGAVNELVDAADDAIAKPTKPIPAGLVPVRHAQAIAIGGVVVMLGASISLGLASAILCLIGTGAGLVYDVRLKRSSYSWLPYLVALPLLPIWVWTALDAFDSRLLWLYPLGGLAVIGVHLAQTLPDIAGDRETGVDTLTARIGERRAIVACWVATLSAPALASAAAAAIAERPVIIWLVALAVCLLVTGHVGLYRVRPTVAIAACFPIVAASVACLGLTWIVAIR